MYCSVQNQLGPVEDQLWGPMAKTVKHFPLSTQYVDLTPWSFAVWWFILLSVHLVTFSYNTAYAMFYYALQHTYLYQMLEYVGIGMPAEDHHVIANVNAVMAALHGICVLLMVGGSLWRRELAFAPWSDEDDTNPARMTSSVLSQKIPHLNDPDRTASRLESAKLRAVQVYTKLWGRQGTFGVNGGNFHMILISRELLETVLQTIQAYRMSWYLPRMLFNRFYLVLLVLNCWSTVLIYLLPFKGSEARKRFGCLLCDCFLDLLSCIGVPLIVVLSYVGQYDAKMTGFAMEKWYDDEWSAHAVNEFQMILVTSWSDLASRTVFSFGLISTTLSMKELLRRAPTDSKRRVSRVADSVWKLGRPSQTNISPETTLPTLHGILNAQESLKAIKVDNGIHRFTGLRSQSFRVILLVAHAIFGMWGIMILGIHIQASMQPELAQCTLQVHPWAVAQPACYLAVLDCYRLDIEGKMDEVESKWREFDRSTVVTLVMRHCPALEIPDLISEFHQATGVKVYNSTIQTWEASAAVTNTNHPALIWLYLVRVNMTDGILPAGILSADFPSLLYDIEICYSNLRELPNDLDSKWLIGTSIYIEYSQLTNVPLALTQLNPYYLVLTGNPIQVLPAEIFEVPDMLYLGLGDMQISELPHNVSNLSPLLSYIYLTYTNISYFWSWIDPLVERRLTSKPPLLMGGSTYCADLDKISKGEAENFGVLPSPQYSVMLTDPTKVDNIPITVSCDVAKGGTFYPIDFDDAYNAIT